MIDFLSSDQNSDQNFARICFWNNGPSHIALIKGPRFSEKDWFYLQAQTGMPFHYLKLVV